jgi:hypothetical protein
MAKWLIVCIVRLIILENRKWFGLVIQIQTLFMLKVLSDSKVCRSYFKYIFKNISNSYSNTSGKFSDLACKKNPFVPLGGHNQD